MTHVITARLDVGSVGGNSYEVPVPHICQSPLPERLTNRSPVTGDDEDVADAGGTNPSASITPSPLTSSIQHNVMPAATLGHDVGIAEAGRLSPTTPVVVTA